MGFSKYRILKESKVFKQTPVDARHTIVLAETDDKITPFVVWIRNLDLGPNAFVSGHYFVKVDSALAHFNKMVKREEDYEDDVKIRNPLTKEEVARVARYARSHSRGLKPVDYRRGAVEAAMTIGTMLGPYSTRKKMRQIQARLERNLHNPLLIVGNPCGGRRRKNPMTKAGAAATLAQAMASGLQVNKKYFDLLLTEVYIATKKGMVGGLPEGHFYAQHMMGNDGGLERFHIVLALAVKNDLIESKGFVMKATKKLIDFVEAK